MASLSVTTSYACQGTTGLITADSIADAPGAPAGGAYSWTVVNQATGTDYGGPVEQGDSVAVPDGATDVRVYASYPDGSTASSTPRSYAVNCAGNTGGGGGTGGGTGGGGTTPPPTPVVGCQDEYADNYDPAATSGGAASCTYTPRWRSAWGPEGVAVRVAAVAGQVEAFVAATLRAGFRAGHPLAAGRPLVDVATLRATVGPDGYATFVLGPYLRPLLGAPDGAGGYRLDLNSLTAYRDLYVGYELRSPDGTLLEHGYVLNAAVPDDALPATVPGSNVAITPFERLPVWPGFSDYGVAQFGTVSFTDGLALLGVLNADDCPLTVSLPCPPNPLPVAWLAPGGGYGYFVFQGKSQLTDVVGSGSTYQEALTGELRYSERGQSRRSYTARSGVFKGPGLAEGLATLWRSPQVWLQPVVGGPWVAVSIDAGSFPVRRAGVLRNEVSVTFVEAAAQYAQGQ